MPQNQSEAIVLKASRFQEQDKLVVLFSPDHGLIEGVAKGAVKSRHRFGSGLEPMSFVKVYYYEKENHRYVTIGSCDLIEDFMDLQSDPENLFTFALFSELICCARPSGGNDELLFRLLRETLRAFKDGGEAGMLTAYFEAWYLKINGLLPGFVSCLGCRSDISAGGCLAPHRDGALCGACAPEGKEDVPEGTARFLDWVRRHPPPRSGEVPFAPEKLAGYRRLLERLIVYHLEQVPQSLRYLANQNNCG